MNVLNQKRDQPNLGGAQPAAPSGSGETPYKIREDGQPEGAPDPKYQQEPQPSQRDVMSRIQRRVSKVSRTLPPDEESKWWPVDTKWHASKVNFGFYDANKKLNEGMMVPKVDQVPDPKNPEKLDAVEESWMAGAKEMMIGEVFEEEKRFLPPASFDPAFDDIEETDFIDFQVGKDVYIAAETDRRRLMEYGNPLTAEDQMDFLLQPQREQNEVKRQREDFNGFQHWGLLKAADVAVDQYKDYKKAHQFINRYMRDVDLFQQWLKHPKIVKHMKKKFRMDMSGKFDKLMALTMALYIRSKIQCHEDDHAGALKSLVAAGGLLTESADLKNPRHRTAMGAVLSARGMVYLALGSPERAEDDLTRCIPYVPAHRFATLYQLRAEARERLGKIEEAREDELRAADIWESGETIHPGMDGPPVKYVM